MSRALGGPGFKTGKARTGWGGGQGRFVWPELRGQREESAEERAAWSEECSRGGSEAQGALEGWGASTPLASLTLTPSWESDLHPEGCSLGPRLPLPLTVSLLSAQCQRLPPARFLVPASRPAIPRPTCSSHQEDGNATRPPQSLAGQRRPLPRLLGGQGQGWTPWRRAPGTGRKGGAP